jgi:hypothetical protein
MVKVPGHTFQARHGAEGMISGGRGSSWCRLGGWSGKITEGFHSGGGSTWRRWYHIGGVIYITYIHRLCDWSGDEGARGEGIYVDQVIDRSMRGRGNIRRSHDRSDDGEERGRNINRLCAGRWLGWGGAQGFQNSLFHTTAHDDQTANEAYAYQ